MTFANFPTAFEQVKDWTWDDIRPYFDDLLARELNAATAEGWLRDRSQLEDAIREIFSRTQVATTQDTADEEAEARYKNLLATVYPHLEQTGNALDHMLLDSGLQPDGLDMALKKIRTDVEIFREENIELQMREQVLGLEFNKIAGALTVEWEGAETTLPELAKVQEDHDRDRRERAWKLSMERYLSVREPINTIWTQLFELRAQKAQNAGFDNYRSYIWQVRHRYDYTPQDADTFHRAIEEVVLPAVQRRTEARRARLGLDVLRPWDLAVDPDGRAPIRPWETIDDFAARAETIFNHVDPELGAYFSTMRSEALLDLPNRKNKGVGAYCTGFPMSKRPFVFMNAVNSRGDVRTLLHEIGHAFHNFEALANLQYSMQRAYPIEFAEVASMAMELLAAPYLTRADGGYFSEADAARDRIEHLEKILDFWPYMAVVDAFQHWAYTHGSEAADPAACDAAWSRLWDRFMITSDYSGMQDIKETGWHRKHHIFRYPFYYIEYGLAQLGAVQVWANALEDQAAAVRAYRSGLALGGTRNLYDLFGATGAKFAFDSQTLGAAVDLIERTINDLEEKV